MRDGIGVDNGKGSTIPKNYTILTRVITCLIQVGEVWCHVGRSPCVQVLVTGLGPIKKVGGLKGLNKVGCGANRFSTPCIPLVALISVVPFFAADLVAWRTAALPRVGTTIATVGRLVAT